MMKNWKRVPGAGKARLFGEGDEQREKGRKKKPRVFPKKNFAETKNPSAKGKIQVKNKGGGILPPGGAGEKSVVRKGEKSSV